MAKEKRTIQDSFPPGSIDRGELRRSFARLRDASRGPVGVRTNDQRSNTKNPSAPIVRKDSGKVKKVAETSARS